MYLERVQTFYIPSNQQNYLFDYVNCKKIFIIKILILIFTFIFHVMYKKYIFCEDFPFIQPLVNKGGQKFLD
jgi:hypothetical protein